MVVAALVAIPLLPASVPFAAGLRTLLVGFALALQIVIAVLLFGQGRLGRGWSAPVLGAGFLFLALMTVAYLLALPGTVFTTRLFGNATTATWLYVFGRAGFFVIAGIYVSVSRISLPELPLARIRMLVGGLIGFDFAAAALTTYLAMNPALEKVFTHGWESEGYRIGIVLLILSATTFLYAGIRVRDADITSIDLWLTVFLLANVIEISLSLANPDPNAVGQYLGKVVWLATSTTFISVLLREINQSTQALTSIANHDALTGLPNRRALDDRLLTLESGRRRHHDHFAMLMIDVDHFKAYNDHYGHGAGDKALCAVASVIRASLSRAADFAGRYGGEEFAILLPDTDRVGALEVALRLRTGIERARIPHVIGVGYLTISIGVVVAAGDVQLRADELLGLADGALYHAKCSGRNRISEASVSRSGVFRLLDEELRLA